MTIGIVTNLIERDDHFRLCITSFYKFYQGSSLWFCGSFPCLRILPDPKMKPFIVIFFSIFFPVSNFQPNTSNCYPHPPPEYSGDLFISNSQKNLYVPSWPLLFNPASLGLSIKGWLSSILQLISINLLVNKYHVSLYGSCLPHWRWFFSIFIHLPSIFLML